MSLRWVRWFFAVLFLLGITGMCVQGSLFYRFPVAYSFFSVLSLVLALSNRKRFASEPEATSLSGSRLSKFQKLCAAMVLRFFGVFLLGSVAYFFLDTLQLEERSGAFLQANGQVVKLDKGGKHARPRYWIKYMVGGVTYVEYEAMIIPSHKLSIGESVTLRYNPGNPQEFLLDPPNFSQEKDLWVDLGLAIFLLWAFMEFWNFQVRRAHAVGSETLPPGLRLKGFQKFRRALRRKRG